MSAVKDAISKQRITEIKDVQRQIAALERRRGVLRAKLRAVSGELHNLNRDFDRLIGANSIADQMLAPGLASAMSREVPEPESGKP